MKIDSAVVATSASTEQPESLYYIQNRMPCGNCVMWWAEGGHGYTCDLGQAGRFTLAEASHIVKSRPEIDRAYPCDEVDRRVVRHVDFQSLRDVAPLKIQVGQETERG